MQRLQSIDPKIATGKTKEMLEAVNKKMGMVPNTLKIMANSPAVLQAYFGFSGALASGILSPAVQEQISLAVSKANGCDYCVAAHSFKAKKLGIPDKDIQKSLEGTSSDKKTDAILKFACLMVEKRALVSDKDVSTLKDAGLNDAEIAEVVANVCLDIFTNYFNHVAETKIDFPALKTA